MNITINGVNFHDLKEIAPHVFKFTGLERMRAVQMLTKQMCLVVGLNGKHLEDAFFEFLEASYEHEPYTLYKLHVKTPVMRVLLWDSQVTGDI